MMGTRERAWKDWLSPPSPWHKGTSVRLWHIAPGLTPASLAMGSEGRVTGKGAAPRALDASGAPAKPDGAAANFPVNPDVCLSRMKTPKCGLHQSGF